MRSSILLLLLPLASCSIRHQLATTITNGTATMEPSTTMEPSNTTTEETTARPAEASEVDAKFHNGYKMVLTLKCPNETRMERVLEGNKVDVTFSNFTLT